MMSTLARYASATFLPACIVDLIVPGFFVQFDWEVCSS